MRIAVAAEGTRGDIYPMLDLAETFFAAGHEVIICAPPEFRAVTTERRMDFYAIGDDVGPLMNGHAEVIARGGIQALRTAHAWLCSSMAHQFEILPERTRGFDLILGAGIQLAGPSAAELHGIPYRYVAYSPAMLPSAAHAPSVMSRQSLPGWANRISWFGMRALYNASLLGPLNQQRARLGLARVSDFYRHILSPRPILAADEELAPLPSDGLADVDQLGCLHAVCPAPLPAKLESFLEQGPAPIYLGFGSMPDPDPARTTRLMIDAVQELGCRAILLQGSAGLGAGPLPEGLFATGTISHAQLFPRVAAVVHHGGAGTTAVAARSGVPQIVIPHVADQFYWARRVNLLGLGPPGPRRTRLTSKRLVAALRETLGNEALYERAQDLGQRIRSRDASRPSPLWLLSRPT